MGLTVMQTEQPTNGSPVLTRQRESQATWRRLIRRLCGSADELRAQGGYSEAETLYLRALALAEPVSRCEEVAVICNNLAVLYKCLGRFDEAEQLYRRALSLMEQSLTSEHRDIATLYHNLGG